MRKNARWVGEKIRCGQCNDTKDPSEYHKNKSRKDGYAGHCKDCANSLYPTRKVTGRGQNKGIKKGKIKHSNRNTAPYAIDPEQYEIERKFSVYKRNHNKPFYLTMKQFEEIVRQPCSYCGGISQNSYVNGIDRVNSDKGYILENCVPCCCTCNFMKYSHTKDFFISHILKIAKHLKLL